MMYWIRDEDTTPQRFPLKKLIQLIVQKLDTSLPEFWILRANGYGLTICEWDELLDENDRLKVDYDLLENISSGTEEWFYDLEVQVVTEDGLQVRFGLHDSTALFIDAPEEFSESIIKSFKIVQERSQK